MSSKAQKPRIDSFRFHFALCFKKSLKEGIHGTPWGKGASFVSSSSVELV